MRKAAVGLTASGEEAGEAGVLGVSGARGVDAGEGAADLLGGRVELGVGEAAAGVPVPGRAGDGDGEADSDGGDERRPPAARLRGHVVVRRPRPAGAVAARG